MQTRRRPENMERITTPALAQAFIDEQIKEITEQVGDKKVLLALSGGVDSSVVAALLIKAIGDKLTCVHVNHGLLRKGDSSISMPQTASSTSWPASLIRSRNATSSARSSSTSSRKKQENLMTSPSWHRALSGPTSLRAKPASRLTTTSAAFPRTLPPALNW